MHDEGANRMKLKIAALTLVSSAVSWASSPAAHAASRHSHHAGTQHRPIFLSATGYGGMHSFRMSASGIGGYAHHASYHRSHGYHSYRSHAHVIQCVAFVQNESEVQLHGNARDWWYNAEGVYARGAAPEVGSVMNFRPIRRMPLGHVALVTGIEDSRTVIIDQSHWGQSGISRDVRVIDVSPDNDWSQVRVALNGDSSRYGSIYPIYGFIYPRGEQASGVMTARASQVAAPQLAEAPETAGTIEEDYQASEPVARTSRRHGMFRHHGTSHHGKRRH
ncbi:CHAP domain-containing protein [Acetobacter sp. AN02]|uniref:CHAP domain-containing protein n=1 Tax=Acetobacter sp. AN02 TaxID=2894186 RepID=UPI0024344FDE|nr:CHAP domain-containing protein [Acetobacter sp. AN02]MDG6094336.1 CHAP domain-containing protein [Acetobacter sp. AN02]